MFGSDGNIRLWGVLTVKRTPQPHGRLIAKEVARHEIDSEGIQGLGRIDWIVAMVGGKGKFGHVRDKRHLAKGMIEADDENEGNHFTVEWDGPDDPNNPKKSDLPMDCTQCAACET